MEPGWMEAAGPLEHDAAEERLTADLLRESTGGHEPNCLAQCRMLSSLLAQFANVGASMGQVQLATALIVALDAPSTVVAGDGRLDEVEGVVGVRRA